MNPKLDGQMTSLEEQLRSSEKRYADLVNNSQGLICTYLMDGTLLSVNPAAAQALGYQPEAMVGKNLADYLAPNERQRFSVYLETLAREPITSGLIHFLNSSGKERVWRYHNTHYDEPGNSPYMLSQSQDVTDRMQAEDRFAKAFRASPAAMAINHLATGHYLDVNEKYLKLVGYNREEVIGHTADELGILVGVPERAQRVLMLQERPVHEIEAQIRTKSGEIRDALVSSEIIMLDGEECGLSLTYDVTDHKEAEKQRLALALEHQRAELLRGFIRDMSHDFKTPLSIINTSLYLLERQTDPEKRQEKLDTIRDQAVHLEKLIQDILALSQLDNAPTLRFSPLNANELLREIVGKFHPVAEKKDIAIQLVLGHIPVIAADAEELNRALMNLVENALHYTSDQGTIRLATYAQDHWIVIEISDSGIGIAEVDLPHIFDRFYRADKARSVDYGGTGLGLAIVSAVVERHRGRIEVESAPGQGSTFRIWLPAIQGDE